MKICLTQTNIVWEDKAANMRRCRELMKEAVESGAELVIFPELSLTGFTMNASLAEHSDGETVLFFPGGHPGITYSGGIRICMQFQWQDNQSALHCGSRKYHGGI